MALTRKMLEELGIGKEETEKIILAHAETVEALKRLKNNEGEIKPDIKEPSDGEPDNTDWKEKFEAVSKELDSFKSETLKRDRRNAMRRLLEECGISLQCVDPILEVTDLNALEIDTEGNPTSPEDAKREIEEKWSAFIPKKLTVGATVASPPKEQGGEKIYTRADLRKMSPGEINRNFEKIIEDLKTE